VALGDVLQSRRTMSELLLEEADSYADAFDAYLELLAEFPREEES
jgi:cobalt-zinc-cadmium efflux system outer membrane protein